MELELSAVRHKQLQSRPIGNFRDAANVLKWGQVQNLS